MLTVLVLLTGVLLFSNTTRAETIGSALVNRGTTDGAEGLIFTNPGAMTFYNAGSLLSWEMYSGVSDGRLITPLLFDQNSVLTGIGATRSIAATGLNSFDFDLVDGTDAVAVGSVFGWRDGAATGAGNAGTISQKHLAGYPRVDVVARVGTNPGDAVVGSTYDQLVHANLPRHYSIQATTDYVSPVIAPAFAAGTPANHGSTAWLINGSTVPSTQGLSGSGPILAQEHVTSHQFGWLINNNDPANELIFSWPADERADLTAVHIWQYTQGCCTNRGVETFDISFSTDGGVTFSVAAPISPPLDQATGGAVNEVAQTRTFPAQTGVTHVKFGNMDSFAPDAQGSWQGLAEVRFEGVVTPYQLPAVPIGTFIDEDLEGSVNGWTGWGGATTGAQTDGFLPSAGDIDDASVTNLTAVPDALNVVNGAAPYMNDTAAATKAYPYSIAPGTYEFLIQVFDFNNGAYPDPTFDFNGITPDSVQNAAPTSGDDGIWRYTYTVPEGHDQVAQTITLTAQGTVTGNWGIDHIYATYAVPEPGGIVLAVLGVLGLALGMRRRCERG